MKGKRWAGTNQEVLVQLVADGLYVKGISAIMYILTVMQGLKHLARVAQEPDL